MGKVFLTGFMATGKTEIGQRLAARLGLEFVDTDAEIERTARMTVRAIFERDGESAFRSLERAAIAAVCDGADAVVATGGGAVLDPANRARMHAAGIVVCLDADPETILRRVGDAATRPLLAGTSDPLARIRRLLAERGPAYRDADHRIDTSHLAPEAVVERIVRAISGASEA